MTIDLRAGEGMSLSISVVIPYFNGSRFIAEALASVRAQTLAPVEIIVVDDGSRAEEAQALDRAAGDCVVVHLHRNRGVSVARNTGIGRARGEWIAFLDCDDVWDPRKLELQAAVVAANPDCRAVHTGLTQENLDGTRVVERKGDLTLEDFLVFPTPMLPSAALMQRQALLECGLFVPTRHGCEDLDLFMRFCLTHGRIHSVPDPLIIRRIQPNGLSRNNAAAWTDAHRIYRDYLPVFGEERGLATLREVHADMLLRALNGGDLGLSRKIVRRATQPDVSLARLVTQVVWRATAFRLSKMRRRPRPEPAAHPVTEQFARSRT
jgi:glycosyltransferase involved in cell wall biosynthesis